MHPDGYLERVYRIYLDVDLLRRDKDTSVKKNIR